MDNLTQVLEKLVDSLLAIGGRRCVRARRRRIGERRHRNQHGEPCSSNVRLVLRVAESTQAVQQVSDILVNFLRARDAQAAEDKEGGDPVSLIRHDRFARAALGGSSCPCPSSTTHVPGATVI